MYQALPDIEAMVDTAGPLNTAAQSAVITSWGLYLFRFGPMSRTEGFRFPVGTVVTYHWDDPDGGAAFAEQEWIPATGVRGDTFIFLPI